MCPKPNPAAMHKTAAANASNQRHIGFFPDADSSMISVMTNLLPQYGHCAF